MIVYPLKEITVDGITRRIPFIRQREQFVEEIDYVILQEDVDPSPPHVYSNLSFKFYGTPDLFYIIDDANPLLHEADLIEGIRVKIPNINTRAIPLNNVISSGIT